jgi:hypothetical protein
VDVACVLLETCGRFLVRNPDTATRMNTLLDIFLRLKAGGVLIISTRPKVNLLLLCVSVESRTFNLSLSFLLLLRVLHEHSH